MRYSLRGSNAGVFDSFYSSLLKGLVERLLTSGDKGLFYNSSELEFKTMGIYLALY
jgi:hypothetical protein